ncbi:MAG: histidine phosphatase family protein [Candidatus Lustribacter sp.]|jgi:broad specificity phosphatase PhoE
MELICVRHGRTAWNADRRFQGQTDIPLDDEGLTQAQALAAHLRDERFDVALASDLSRARTTAETICAEHDLALELTPALREMHFGAWEGLTWEQIVKRWPELDAAHAMAPMYYTAEGGESWDALCARIDAFLRATAARIGPEGRALLVSHAGVMHAIVRSLTSAGRTDADPVAVGVRFSPAGILRARGSFESGWDVFAINEQVSASTRSAR